MTPFSDDFLLFLLLFNHFPFTSIFIPICLDNIHYDLYLRYNLIKTLPEIFIFSQIYYQFSRLQFSLNIISFPTALPLVLLARHILYKKVNKLNIKKLYFTVIAILKSSPASFLSFSSPFKSLKSVSASNNHHSIRLLSLI